MVRVVRAVVDKGIIFPVEMDLNRGSAVLDLPLRREGVASKRFAQCVLNFYHAKRGNAWLTVDDEDTKVLTRGEIRDGIQSLLAEDMAMFASRWRVSSECLGWQFVPEEGDVHILVKVQTNGVKLHAQRESAFIPRQLSRTDARLVDDGTG